MKGKSNINHLLYLQQESNQFMRANLEIKDDLKLAHHIQQEQSTIYPIDLRQILNAQDFQYSKWNQDDPFPNVFAAMTPYMIGKFSKYRKACHFCILSSAMGFGNLTKDIGLLMTLNSNLEPSVLATVIYQKSKISPSNAFTQLLNLVNSKCQITNMILFCNQPQLISESVQYFNEKESKQIHLQLTYLAKETILKEMLTDYQICRKPYLKKQCFQLIGQLLEQKDQKKWIKLIQRFKEWNPIGYHKFMNCPRPFKFIHQLPQSFYGFSLFKKYDNLIQSFIKKLRKQKIQTQTQFFNKIVMQQYLQMELKRSPCYDQCSIFQMNSRVKQLVLSIQPNPLTSFLQNYQKSLSFKQKKINSTTYIIGGKAGSAYQIKKQAQNQWFCQCGQTYRTGIPCEHLLKICSIEKLEFEPFIDQIYRIGHQKPFLRVD